ncbi:uncharacterized protein ACIQIH_012715 isoform 2-T3 [Cyanocitta cristata]
MGMCVCITEEHSCKLLSAELVLFQEALLKLGLIWREKRGQENKKLADKQNDGVWAPQISFSSNYSHVLGSHLTHEHSRAEISSFAEKRNQSLKLHVICGPMEIKD